MVVGRYIDDHHLIPKTFKGREKITLHRICHNQIHALWTERELCNYYHTVKRIVEDVRMVKFILWVSKKDPDFYIKTRPSKRVKKKKH